MMFSVERALEEAQRLPVCASTPGARRAEALRQLFLSTHAESVRLTLRRGNDVLIEVEVPCVPATTVVGAPVRLWFRPEVRWAAPGVGYFAPGGMFSSPEGFREADPETRELLLADTYRAYEKIMDGFAGAHAFVLDLRGNPGGTDSLGQHVARLLAAARQDLLPAPGAHGHEPVVACEALGPLGPARLDLNPRARALRGPARGADRQAPSAPPTTSPPACATSTPTSPSSDVPPAPEPEHRAR